MEIYCTCIRRFGKYSITTIIYIYRGFLKYGYPQFSSMLISDVPLPVVPHKAVAEVSKIGNL